MPMKEKKKKLGLHWQILIGMGIGLIWALIALKFGGQKFTIDWVKPFGDIFLRMLKMIAVPLVLVSLIQGVSSLSDISSLSRMGLKSIGLYMLTTLVSIFLGLAIVNAVQPGKAIPETLRGSLQEKYGKDLPEPGTVATDPDAKVQGPLAFLVKMVPDNIFQASTDNKSMLKVIFFALLFGVALVMIPAETAAPVKQFFDGTGAVILKMVDIIMAYAPLGVAALLAGVLVEIAGNDPAAAWGILQGLGLYSITVLIGLFLLIGLFYPILLMLFIPWYRNFNSLKSFYINILPVHLVAFSTSSSAAALPINMERCEEGLGLKKETTAFVLPLGATINMDGTSLYQAVAALFIAQAYGLDLSFLQQMMIVLTCVLASIGSAAVPSAGMVMLVIVLSSIGLDAAGIALVMAPDRILDMFRTVANVTSDATVASIVDYRNRDK